MVYGRFCRYSGSDGAVYPSIPTLASELGIGKTQARKYIQELEGEQFIKVDRENRRFRADGSGGSNWYVFLWHAAFDGEQGNLRKNLPVRKTGGEESHHQESPQKESQLSKKSQIATPSERERKPVSRSLVDDDDSRVDVDAPAACNPWEALRAAFGKANGDSEISRQDETWLKEQMELRNITADALFEMVRTNPLDGFRSPMAGLKWLVKKFCSKTQLGSASEKAAGIAGRLPAKIEAPRCEKCANSGRILEYLEGVRPKM